MGISRLRFVLLMALLLAAASLPASALFSLQRIEVEGTRTLSPDEVREASGLAPGGRSIFLIDAQEIARSVRRHPRIAAARVWARPPHTVVISIRERVAVAAVPAAGGYALVDSSGVAVEISAVRPSLPLVSERGRPLPWVAPGEQVPAPPVRVALAVLVQMTEEMRREVVHVQVRQDNEVFLYTGDGIEIRAGPVSGLQQRLTAAPQLLRMIRAQGTTVEYLDLSLPDQAIIKPRSP